LEKYKIIYADPPWNFKTYSDKGKEKSAENHYKCMNIDDIYNLPVNEIADKDSVLFLWVTFPLLQEGLETIKQWGFQYKTCGFNWFKKNKKTDSWFWGLGYYSRSCSEICLLATKGKILERMSKSVHQVIDTDFIDTKIEQHSKKPDLVRDRIVQLFGDIPRIELFARQKTDGWNSLGYDIDGMDIRDSLKKIIDRGKKNEQK
jgi:N6-adenosine-specific RNA methylase IME4